MSDEVKKKKNMEKKRIAVGGIEHESTSFLSEHTPLTEFMDNRVSGDRMKNLGNANTVMDGFVRGVAKEGMELVPLFFAQAMAGGLPSRDTLDTLVDKLIRPLENAMPVDGVLLSLHGSFAAEGVDDADGFILEAVRKVVGPDCPLFAVHDMHGNITQAMVRAADVLIIERTYPHVDMAERAMEAARLMALTVSGAIRPTMAFRSIPLLWSARKMDTSSPPMLEAISQLEKLDTKRPTEPTDGSSFGEDNTKCPPMTEAIEQLLEKDRQVLCSSIGVGYQWIDHPYVGASAIVVTDGDMALAQKNADEVASWVWERRKEWQSEPISPTDALDRGESLGKYPIILADQADNTGGGAPGDSTEILRLFIERDLQDAALLYMVDAEAVKMAMAAGVGSKIEIKIGGKSHPALGPPVKMDVEILTVCDGKFVYDGPMWKGVRGDLGQSVLLKQKGVYVVVTSIRNQPVDMAFSRTLGLDCTKMKYLALKSTGHFRSGFGDMAGSIFNVDAAGLFSQDFSKIPYTRLGRDVYPLNLSTEIDW